MSYRTLARPLYLARPAAKRASSAQFHTCVTHLALDPSRGVAPTPVRATPTLGTQGHKASSTRAAAAAMAAKDTTSKMFVVCGRDADLLYEAELNANFDAESPTAHLSHFVLHAALDNVDHLIATTPDVYLRVVDNFNEKRVYAFCTGGHAKFLLLHEGRNEDAVRNFFNDVYDKYVQALLNPFYVPDAEITSPSFDRSVRAAAKRYL